MSRPAGTAFAIEGGRPFTGRVRVPGDKSISHRAVIIAALADGVSVVRGRSEGEDVRHTEAATRRMGAHVEGERIGGGERALRPPEAPIGLGNSGTSMRLLAGVVAGRPWTVELTGDPSLSSRPMDRVAVPLRLMGAQVEGRTERCLPPLVVRGGSLHGIDYSPVVASAQVKSCVLLAGLRADGQTVVRERVLTRRHTEEILALCGAEVSESYEGGDHVVKVLPGQPQPFELNVPADPSQAAFWVVAACLAPGSEVTVERVYVGAARRGFLDVLKRMGARLDELPATRPDDLAATADVVVRSGSLVATEVDAAEIPGLDEVPVLAVAAARAEGTTVFRGVGELRVKESDRLVGVAEMVRAFGASADVEADDLFVTGVRALRAGNVDAHGDHRIAMAAAVAGASVPDRATRIVGWEAVSSSYPTFAKHMADLTEGRAT
ncbi:MAG: 3-phosphoshikimate 1-carboxyvinyltransferase [Acidimicrobiales bacterium]|jgi:3-phosphoshikimate 1-carboxyvinyltransferase